MTELETADGGTETANANGVIEVGILNEIAVEIGSVTVGMVVTGTENGSGSVAKTAVKETERGPVVTDQSHPMPETNLHVRKPVGSNAMATMIKIGTRADRRPYQANLSPRRTPTPSNAKHATENECSVSNKIAAEPSSLIPSPAIAVRVDRNASWAAVASTTNTRTSSRSMGFLGILHMRHGKSFPAQGWRPA